MSAVPDRDERVAQRFPWVVVADDDPDIRKLVSEILVPEGYHVEVVEDGLLALNVLVASARPCVSCSSIS
jgi:CheY-like chemotaxis protein